MNSDDVVSGSSPEHQPLIESPATLALAGLLATSAVLQLYLLTAALAILLGMIGVARLWSLLSLRSLNGDRRLTYERLFPGDTVELVMRLENRKLLPLAWVEISQPLPSGLLAKDNAPVSTMRGALLWYQAATFRPLLTCQRRGYYRLGPATITSGDPFGIYPNQRELRQPTSLLVYPRLYPLSDMQLAPNALFGEALSPRHLLYDPINSAGSRDYVSGDPVRHMHWKATAKRQRHQVKVFEPTTNVATLLLLAIDSFERRAEHDLELGISAAASLAAFINGRQSPVGLLANARLHMGEGAPWIAPRMGQTNLMRILEALALVSGQPIGLFFDLVKAHLHEVSRDTTLVFIHAEPTPTVYEELRRLNALGHHTALFSLAGNRVGQSGQPVKDQSLRALLASAAEMQKVTA